MHLSFRTRHLAVLAIAIILLTGCSIARGTVPPGEVERAQIVAGGLRDSHLTLELELEHPFLVDRMRLDVWHVRPDCNRLEVLESGQLGFKGLVAGANGAAAWSYHPLDDRLDRGPVATVAPAILYDVITTTMSLIFAENEWNIRTGTTGYAGSRPALVLTLDRPTGDCSLWLAADSLLARKVECEDTQLGRFRAVIHDARYNLEVTDDVFGPEFLPVKSHVSPSPQ